MYYSHSLIIPDYLDSNLVIVVLEVNRLHNSGENSPAMSGGDFISPIQDLSNAESWQTKQNMN